MKKNYLLLIALAVTIGACVEEPIVLAETVYIEADKFGVFANGTDAITFTVSLDSGTDVTNECDIYVGGVVIDSNVFSGTTAGELEVYASYNNLDSETIFIGVVDRIAAPATYTTKLLVEDFTGAWCGYCPRIAYKLEEAVHANPNIVPVAVHSGDRMEFALVSPFMNKYSITSFPTALLNRSEKWNESPIGLNNKLGESSVVGLSISSEKNGEKLDVTIKVGFATTIVKPLKLVVVLTEDGIHEDQRNYMNSDDSSPWSGAGDPIIDYVHNHVLRVGLTDIFGDKIPPYETLEEHAYTATFSTDISEYNFVNLKLVAFVLENPSDRLYNVQIAKAGSVADFD